MIDSRPNTTTGTPERDSLAAEEPRGVDAEAAGRTDDEPADAGEADRSGAAGGSRVEGDVADRVRGRSEVIADREVERALRTLEARGDLTEGQRRAVREMADGIVESLVATPARTVEAAGAADDEALRTVVELFEPDR